ncbi:MAG TPA: hypothetical protein VMA31_10745 [Bryobacteraceae bacterium]|nr:hypothetical protein [Bryobacteraceae bacterium]
MQFASETLAVEFDLADRAASGRGKPLARHLGEFPLGRSQALETFEASVFQVV